MKTILYSKPTQMTIDGMLCAAAWFAAFQLRFGGEVTPQAYSQMLRLLPFVAAGQVFVNRLLGVYRLQWRYVSGEDALYIARAYVAFWALLAAASLSLGHPGFWLHVPLTIVVTAAGLALVGALAARLARRLVYHRHSDGKAGGAERRFLLVGAGTHGAMLAREMMVTKGIKVVGFVDDDPHKQNAIIAGAKVLGRTADLTEIVAARRIDEVLVCISPRSRGALRISDAVPSRIVPTLEDILENSGVETVLAGPAQNIAPGTRPVRPATPVSPALSNPREKGNGKANGNGNGNGNTKIAALIEGTVSVEQVASGAVAMPPAVRETRISGEVQGKTILITGGAGFIGSSLAQKLVEHNRLILLDHAFAKAPIQYTSLLKRPNVAAIQGSILELDLASLVKQADVVVHAAAILGVSRVCSAGRETLETNYVGTSRLLKALEGHSGLERFVYFSTSEVFGVNSYRVGEATAASVGPIAESRWSYAMSKLAGEHLVASYFRETGLPMAIIRPFNIFGPRRTGDYALRRFIVSALTGEPLELHGDGTQIRSWCYIDDFCSALLQMIQRPEAVGQDFNIGNPGNTLTIYELAQKVIQLCASSSPIVFRESPFPDISIRVPSLEKARRLLDYEPRIDLNTALKLTIRWYREHLMDMPQAARKGPVDPVAA